MNRSKLNVLVVFANPRGTSSLKLGTEDRVIRESIRLSRYRDDISLTIRHATTVHDLRRSLLDEDFQIVHISGHGTGAGLVLEDDLGGMYVAPQQALADLFQAYESIQCVILNACYSISKGQLMSLGIPFTIAMEGSISDKAAIEFSRGFYDAVGAKRGIDFAYDEGCRTVNLAAQNTQFVSKILRKGETYSACELNDSEIVALPPSEPLHFSEARALVGLAIDLSGSMANSMRNDTGGQLSRLESFRRSLENLLVEAKSRVDESRAKEMQTSIDLFSYGFGLRAMNVCDLFSLIKIGKKVITKEEIEELKQRYVHEAQRKYSEYEGLGDLAKQYGFGGLINQFSGTIRANAESEIRRKVLLEVKSRIDKEIGNTGDTTLSIEEVARLWKDSENAFENAEELIFGNTPMREGLTEVAKRFERELKTRDKYTAPILFILSDGEPTDGNPLPIIESLRSLGVIIISCFVTEQNIANPRVLFGQLEPQWNQGAKLMFEMSSTVQDDSAFVKFLLRKNWVVHPNSKLFVQANHSVILEEFIRVALSPFESSSDIEILPRGL